MEENLREGYVKSCMKRDLFAYDFLLSIFISAANSYRHDTVLRPFPQSYQKSGKEFELLRKDISCLEQLENVLVKDNYNEKNLIDLLYWVFSTKKFTLKSCDICLFPKIQEKTGHTFQVATPTYLFEVVHCPLLEDKFESVRGPRDLLYAYHGSKLENFFSILHNGLRNSLNKNALFGEGTYLSSELSVSLDYSPYGHGWSESVLGGRLSCVAVCEIIDDISVKCKVQDDSKENIPGRSRVAGSIGGDVPEKYYVITNDDVIRIKYILVYSSRDKYLKKQPSWFAKHRFLLIMVAYFLMLVLIGVYQSTSLRSSLIKWLPK